MARRMKVNVDASNLVSSNVVSAKIDEKPSMEQSRHRNAVDRMFGDTSEDIADEAQMSASASSKKLAEIPIEMISERSVNEYPVDRIEQLAEDIEKVGLIQPIIVRKNKTNGKIEQTYIVVVGHRRLAAFKYLKEKYKKSDNKADRDGFNKITAYILESDEELKNEEQIYRSSNDQVRRISNLDRVVRLHPDEIDMNQAKWQKRYVEEVYGKDKLPQYDAGQIEVPTGLRAKAKLIAAMIANDDPSNVDISEATVRAYLMFFDRCCDELKKATIRRLIPARDAINYISFWPIDEQISAIEAYGTDDYKKYLVRPVKPIEAKGIAITWNKAKKDICKNVNKSINSISKLQEESYRKNFNEQQNKEIDEVISKLKEISAMFE